MTPFEKAKSHETTCKNCEKSERVNGVLYCTANGKIIMPSFEDMCLCIGYKV